MDNLKDSTEGIFGKGVGRMITEGEWLLRESCKGYKVVVIDPEDEFKELAVKHQGGRIDPLEIK